MVTYFYIDEAFESFLNALPKSIKNNKKLKKDLGILKTDIKSKIEQPKKPKKAEIEEPMPGVYYHSRDKKWMAQIMIHGNRHYLGSYKTLVEANAARKGADKLYIKLTY